MYPRKREREPRQSYWKNKGLTMANFVYNLSTESEEMKKSKYKSMKGGKSTKYKSMRGGRKASMPQTFNEMIKKKIGGKV